MRKLRRTLHRSIAWILIAVFIFSSVGESGIGMFKVEAKGIITASDGDDAEQIGGVISLAGDSSAVIKADGSLWMWGNNSNGQLGIGSSWETLPYSDVPIKVMEDVKAVSHEYLQSAAIKNDNSLWVWGNWGDPAFFGDTNQSNVPIKFMEDVEAVSIGSGFGAAIKKDGSLWTWGSNTWGELGNGTREDSIIPIKIMDDVSAVSLGFSCGAVIKKDGSLWMWGSNSSGQLGNGTREDSLTPIKIMEDVKAISANGGASLAVKKDGSLWVWGSYSGVVKGTEYWVIDDSTVPTKIMEDVKAVSSGSNHYVIIKKDGSMWTWGTNNYGQLGNGTTACEDDDSIPTKIMENVKLISVGYNHNAAVKENGSLCMWGGNYDGQLGNGTTEDSAVPIEIMPAGSINVSGKTTSSIDIESLNAPEILVKDSRGVPISGAAVTYRGETLTTSDKGIVTLHNYEKGNSLSISKDNYETKTIQSFTKNRTGRMVYILSPLISHVTMISNGEETDLLAEEATINKYYKSTEFSIRCEGGSEISSYELYSGVMCVAKSSDGVFDKLLYNEFMVGQSVYLKPILQDQSSPGRIKLGIQVISKEITVPEFAIGDSMKIPISDDIPIVGGKTLEIELGNSPVEVSVDTDGEIKIGINAEELVKSDKDWFSTLKYLNKNNVQKYLDEVKNKSANKTDKIKPEIAVIGYMEGNVKNPDHLTGRIFVELSMENSWENQYQVWVVPVVVEVSVSGKINADGSLTYTVDQGYSGTLSVGGEVGLGLYGGVGIADVISGGIYGKAALGLTYDILPWTVRGLNQLYVKGAAGVKGKVLGTSHELELVSGTYYIINKTTGNRAALAYSADSNNVFIIDNDKVYPLLDRSYLSANGGMEMQWMSDRQVNTDGGVQETELQGAAYQDIIPTVVRTGDTVMLFYLTDAGAERTDADRSMLVYSIWDSEKENWSEPKPVLDDGTADFSLDIYSDGSKVYAVWQNAEESLAGELTLNEIADRLTLHAAVYDPEAEETGFIDLGAIESKNGLFQQQPQITVDGDIVSVYWHENEQDNVLGLSGTNRIYQAVLADADATYNSIFSKYVATYETDMTVIEEIKEEETESEEENIPEEDEAEDEKGAKEGEGVPEDDENIPDISEDNENATDPDNEENPEDGLTESDDEDILDETQAGNYDETAEDVPAIAAASESAWKVSFLQDEANSIVSADAGIVEGKIAYGYVAGKLDEKLELTDGSVVMLTDGATKKTLETGICGHVEFTTLYGEETLTWYRDGDIRYVNKDGSIKDLFGESRLSGAVYTLLSDGNNVELIFPVNMGGRSNLYRIASEGGEFGAVLPVTDQENYIQYVDGFIDGDRTIMVYNRMEAEVVESETGIQINEKNNSLYTGALEHSYRDLVMYHAGSMVRQDEETGEDVLEITAQVGNNGTVSAEGIGLTLKKADGTELETKSVDTVLESGETEYITALFSLDNITEEGEYTVTVSESGDSNTANNSTTLTLGEVSLQVSAEVIAVGDTRTMQIGIQNTGVTSCGGTVSVQDAETGEVYCSSEFEPIARGQISFAEIEIDNNIFKQKEVLLLEAVVVPEKEGQESVSDYVTVYAPTYTVDFVTQIGGEADGGTHTETVFVGYGKRAEFPVNPTKAGEYFIGWYTAESPEEGTLYTEETSITSDVTLYACFAKEQGSISLESCSVSEIPIQLYTGKALKPAVTVKWGSEVLSSKTDYSVSYQNNKEQGKATVTITGKGKYSGSITRTFMILYPFNKVSVKALPAVDFTGEYYTPEVKVTYRNETLTKGKDYTVTYSNNRNAGIAGVALTGIGKYSGTKTVTFAIKGLSITKDIVFEKPGDVVYSGGKQTPVITVKTKAGEQLQAGSDYKVVYENAINKGTATATVIGNGNFIGTKKLTYKILAKQLTVDMISKIGAQPYTGSAIKPEVIITDESTSSEPLVQGKDYTISYSKNKAAGMATVTVKGKGNYSGTVKTSFEIAKVDLKEEKDNGQLTVQVNDMAYTGKAVKPSVQIYEGTKKLPASAYTVAYSNNVGTGSGNDIATVTITGKGNYTGTISANFRIVDKAKLIASLKIDKVTNVIYTGSAIEPGVTIKDGDYELKKGVDYETTYRNQYNAGKATVTITGIGSYAGSKNVTYQITKRAIADRNTLAAGFTIEPVADLKYTGYALKPDIVMRDGDKVLTLGEDYKLSYKNNTKISTGTKTATITVTGIGNYSGSINTTTFKIVSWDYSKLQAEIPDQVYTGKALKPQVMFYLDGELLELKSGTAVKITYADNKYTGTATATITGKGELSNMNPIKIAFAIEQASIEDAIVGKVKNQTLKGVAVKPIPKVKVGKTTLKAGRDFTVSYLRNGVKGEAEMIITGIGNYTGKCRKSFIVQ